MSVSFNQIPRDVQLLVFSYLKPEELGRYSRVCKIWRALANTESLWKALHPSIAFGKREWEKYLGDVGEEPPLPREVYKILKSPCPFWEGKRVEETHLLTLIPRSVNGEPLTLNYLDQLMQHPKQGRPTKFRYDPPKIAEELSSQPLLKSIWVLLTREIIPGSQAITFDDQVQLLTKQSHEAGMGYEVPKLLEATTSIFMEYLRAEKRLYGDAPQTFTRCQERLASQDSYLFVVSLPSYPLAVGAFGKSDLKIFLTVFNLNTIGLGGLKKI